MNKSVHTTKKTDRFINTWVRSPKLSYPCPLKLRNEVAAAFPEPGEFSVHFPRPDVSFPYRQRPPKINFLLVETPRARTKFILGGR